MESRYSFPIYYLGGESARPVQLILPRVDYKPNEEFLLRLLMDAPAPHTTNAIIYPGVNIQYQCDNTHVQGFHLHQQQRHPGPSDLLQNVPTGDVASIPGYLASNYPRDPLDPNFSILRHLLENGTYLQNYNQSNVLHDPCLNYVANHIRTPEESGFQPGMGYYMTGPFSDIHGNQMRNLPPYVAMALAGGVNNYTTINHNYNGQFLPPVNYAAPEGFGYVNLYNNRLVPTMHTVGVGYPQQQAIPQQPDMQIAMSQHLMPGEPTYGVNHYVAAVVPLVEVVTRSTVSRSSVNNISADYLEDDLDDEDRPLVIDERPQESEIMRGQLPEQPRVLNEQSGQQMETATFYHETDTRRAFEEQFEPIDLSFRWIFR